MNADLTRLMDMLRIRLPGALDDTIKLELFSTLNEFFQDSNSWLEEIQFPVTSGVTDYTIKPTSVSSVVRLIGVINGSGIPVRATLPEPDLVELESSPSDTGSYTAQVVLTVNNPLNRDGVPDFPDWVLRYYFDEIQDGVLGRMMSQLAKPYVNERLAIYHMRRFRGGIARAKVEAQHKYVYRGQNWKFPQSFARRRSR